MNSLRRVMLPLRHTMVNPKYWLFIASYLAFRRLSRTHPRGFPLRWADRYPILNDSTAETSFDAHYIFHPAWAARIVAETKPAVHIDVASTLHFCTMVSAFVPVEFYDIRPARLNLSGLSSKHGDLKALPFADQSIESLSCMHVVEHVGLGRYGDPLDPVGDLTAMAELRRVLAGGGSLLFVVPVGKPVIRYNAHRIYSYDQIASEFSDLHVRQFALIDDHGRFMVDASPDRANAQEYGCGCWWFRK